MNVNDIFKILRALCYSLVFFIPFTFAAELYDDEGIEDELIGIEESIDEYELLGELLLRSDTVRDLPRGTEKDFDRVKVRALLGIMWTPNDTVEVGLAAKLNISSQNNSKTRFNLDNERADSLSLDELYVNYQVSDQTSILLGQTHFPLRLTPMLWDEDLRPQGISLNHKQEFGDFNSVDLTGGVFLANHLYGDDTNIKAVQAAINIGEGKNAGYRASVAYLDFNNLDGLAENGISRTNLTSNGSLTNDIDIADLQFEYRFNQHALPMTLRLNLINNLAVSDDDSAARIDFIVGKSIRTKGIELGLATQRIQREAVVAAFNDDDWWFPTRMRGTTAWVAYGVNESVRVKGQIFTERRDDKAKHNKRALFDLQYFF